MNKNFTKGLSLALSLAMLLAMGSTVALASEPDSFGNSSHEHHYGNWQQFSKHQHVKTCACGEDPIYENHTWNNGVISTEFLTVLYTCTGCGYEKMEVYVPHEHSYGIWQMYSDTQHQKVCLCGKDSLFEAHAWDDGTVISEASCTQAEQRQYTCTECGYQKIAPIGSVKHIRGDWQQHDDKQHKKTCSCGSDTTYANHFFDNGLITTTPSCTQSGIKTYTCTGCGYQKTETIPKSDHTLAEWVVENDTQHKHRCSCGFTETFEHVYEDEEDPLCNDCGYKRILPISSEPGANDFTTQETYNFTNSGTERTFTSPIEKERTSHLPGCRSTLALGTGFTFLLSIGSMKLFLKKTKD